VVPTIKPTCVHNGAHSSGDRIPRSLHQIKRLWVLAGHRKVHLLEYSHPAVSIETIRTAVQSKHAWRGAALLLAVVIYRVGLNLSVDPWWHVV
jgi:hypothetical protein